MMDTTTATTDDNFFIEEPQKLRSNFFNKDKSIQLVELLAQQQQKHQKKHLKHNQQHYINNSAETDKMMELSKIQACRLTYIKKLRQFQNSQLDQPSTTTMPRSLIDRLECLCKRTYETDDLNVARQAVDALVGASQRGCCFLEKYIVMLMKFCITKNPISPDPLKIKIDELMNRVLNVDFDRQQLVENLRRPEYKLTSVDHLVQLLRTIQDMLDYREHVAVNWLIVVLDAYFVDLATSEQVVDIMNQISAHIDFQCALLRQTEATKCLLKTIVQQIDDVSKQDTGKEERSCRRIQSTDHVKTHRYKAPCYAIEQIEF